MLVSAQLSESVNERNRSLNIKANKSTFSSTLKKPSKNYTFLLKMILVLKMISNRMCFMNERQMSTYDWRSFQVQGQASTSGTKQCGYKLKCSCGHSYIGQTQRNLKFRLDEHNPKKSSHQATDVVKRLYTYPDHFMDFKNPEILASAFNYRELLIKETLLIQEQQPEINVDNFPPLYTSSIRRFYVK